MRIPHLRVSILLVAVAATLGQASPIANPAAPAPELGRPVAGLQLTLNLAAQGALEVTFQNQDKKPMVLNLGIMLGNGRILIPDQLHLIVTDASRKSRVLDVKGVAGIAGRVDDFLVPLMPDAKYTMTFAADDFLDPSGKATLATGETVQAVYRGTVPSNRNGAAIPDLPVWTQKVDSGPVQYSE